MTILNLILCKHLQAVAEVDSDDSGDSEPSDNEANNMDEEEDEGKICSKLVTIGQYIKYMLPMCLHHGHHVDCI